MGLKRSKSSFLFLSLILLVSLGDHCCVGLGGASAASIIDEKEKVPCNGTLGDCFSGNRDEFELEGGELLRHYAAGGRWLLQTGPSISYGSLQRPPVCSTDKYSNCIVGGGGSGRCADYNRCKRAPG